VLDLGCGTGALTDALAIDSRFKRIVGVDYSDDYIAHAQSRNTNPRIEFHVGDATSLNFDDASFDMVLSMLMLHFVPDAERAIIEMCRVATSGATVAAAVWDARGGFVSHRIFWDTAAAIDIRADQIRAASFTRPMSRPGELAQAFNNAGLVDVKECTLGVRMDYASFEDFWAPNLGGQGPAAAYVASLEPDHRRELQARVRSAYLDGDADGPRSYAALAWSVKGHRHICDTRSQ
jgi:SAM-dependent methyltransferase